MSRDLRLAAHWGYGSLRHSKTPARLRRSMSSCGISLPVDGEVARDGCREDGQEFDREPARDPVGVVGGLYS